MIKLAIEQIEPFVTLSSKEDVNIPLYNSQAELQLLSKLRSQSYRAYISDLAKLPASDISTDLDVVDDIDIKREETMLTVSSLLPTQREIFLDAVLPRMKEDDGPRYFADVIEIGPPIITFNGRFVIDGHHRWLSAALINPRGKISSIDFVSETLTPIQFLKLIQGAIVMDAGELPEAPKDKYNMDLFHKSNKDILEYINQQIPKEVLSYIKTELKLQDQERALHYVGQNALNVKYNNLPAVGSPSRELMPQTSNKPEILDIVEEAAPVLKQSEDK
ncbi:MAG: hypothetical protein NC218_01305 [Acetobacter sp.]|nr:hypothetical protein [Acetobacter sp.]